MHSSLNDEKLDKVFRFCDAIITVSIAFYIDLFIVAVFTDAIQISSDSISYLLVLLILKHVKSKLILEGKERAQDERKLKVRETD